MSLQVFTIKLVHSLIYIFMSTCIGYLYIAAFRGWFDWKLAVAIGMIMLEVVVLGLSGWRCPLSTWARALGDETGHDLVSDYLLPDWMSRLTVPFCTLVVVLGLILLLVMYVRSL